MKVKVRMNFDTNILNVICEHIDDPKTYFNFALVCRKTRYVTELHKNNKMDEFSIKYVKTIDHGMVKVVERRLPNGKLHGVKVFFWTSDIQFNMYYNGICLGTWWCSHYEGLGQEITITYFKCDCAKGKGFCNSYIRDKIVSDGYNSYIKDKIVLDGVGYKLYFNDALPFIVCDTCGDHDLEQEVWCNFEREKLP